MNQIDYEPRWFASYQIELAQHKLFLTQFLRTIINQTQTASDSETIKQNPEEYQPSRVTDVNQTEQPTVEEDSLEEEARQPVYDPETVPPIGNLVGLSLSFCVKDIATGKIPYERVVQIIASTNYNLEDRNDIAELCQKYGEYYWKGNIKQTCFRIVDKLIADNKIRQPRREGGVGTNISRGRWLLQNDLQDEEDYPHGWV